MNLRPLGYEPNELPSCSTPRYNSSSISHKYIMRQACKYPFHKFTVLFVYVRFGVVFGCSTTGGSTTLTGTNQTATAQTTTGNIRYNGRNTKPHAIVSTAVNFKTTNTAKSSPNAPSVAPIIQFFMGLLLP